MSDKEQPTATHEGELKIGDRVLAVAVLKDGKRMITQKAIFKAFGRPMRGSRDQGNEDTAKLPGLIDAKNLKAFISNELTELIKPITYTSLGGNSVAGYDAMVLPLICDVYLDARNAKTEDGKSILTAKQEPNAVAAEMLMRSLSKVGIIALVDEATGYQNAVDRAKDELQQLLSKFLLQEYSKWVKTFPDEFFEMIFKMKGWNWFGITKTKRPQVIGHYINDLIYERLAPQVLDELRVKNPVTETGARKTKHHQWLTPDLGHPKLKEHLSGVLALGRASSYNWATFMRMMNKSYPKFGHTLELLFPNDNPLEIGDRTKFDKALGALMKVPKPEN